jgi:hypothetical protein
MSEARKEILRLIAEGKVTPEEGDRLLRALDEAAADGRRDPAGSAPEGGPARGGRFADGIAQMLEEVGETVRRAVEDAVGSAQRAFDEHRSTTEAVEVRDGGFAIPAGARLKVQQALRISLGGGSKGDNVILRTVSGADVRVIRGEAIEAHRNGSDYVLTWAKGNLELEVPRNLAGLDVRCMGGDLEVHDFIGPMSMETMGGELRVLSPRAPFRFRTLGGRIRIADCDLRDGAAVISSTGGDVAIELSPSASITVHASTLGGMIDAPPEAMRDEQGRTRRRAVCVFGQGAAELRIDTLGGDVRIRQV